MWSTLPVKIAYSSLKQNKKKRKKGANSVWAADACVSPHSYLLSSFPSRLSHLSCNRLSPFAVAPAFMEYSPQGVRVIVCLFLKAGVKSKDHSLMRRTSVVGVSRRQNSFIRHKHRCDMFFLASGLFSELGVSDINSCLFPFATSSCSCAISFASVVHLY